MYQDDFYEESQAKRRETFPVVLSPAEVMDILGIGKNTVYRLLTDGTLKGVRVGRNWKIPLQALDEFVTH